MPAPPLRSSALAKLDQANVIVERETNGTFSGYVVNVPGVFAAADSARATRAGLRRSLAAHRSLLASLPGGRRGDKGVGKSDGTSPFCTNHINGLRGRTDRCRHPRLVAVGTSDRTLAFPQFNCSCFGRS